MAIGYKKRLWKSGVPQWNTCDMSYMLNTTMMTWRHKCTYFNIAYLHILLLHSSSMLFIFVCFKWKMLWYGGGGCGRDRMVVGFTSTYTSVSITTSVVISNPSQARCTQYNIVSDLQQVGGFLRALRFPPPIKLTTTI